MLETAIVLPIFILLFLGIFHFGLRSMNQSRVAMAARYAAWMGGHGNYNNLNNAVTTFLPAATNKNSWYTVNISKKYLSTQTGVSIIDDMLKILPSSLVDQNVQVTLSYSQNKLRYAAPDRWDQQEAAFIWTATVTNYSITVDCINNDFWQDMNTVIEDMLHI